MLRKLSKIGDQVGLVIDPALLEAMRIDEGTELEIETDGHSITIRPIKSTRQTERLRADALSPKPPKR